MSSLHGLWQPLLLQALEASWFYFQLVGAQKFVVALQLLVRTFFCNACSVCLCVAGMSLCRKILQLFFGPLLVQAMRGAQSLTTPLDHENSYGLRASSSSCFLEGQCCNLLVLWKGIAGCRMRKSFSWKAAISLAIWETSVFVAKAKGLYKINLQN